MGSEQVASVLRQSGSHVRLIVARSVIEPLPSSQPSVRIVLTNQLDEHLHNMYAALLDADNDEYHDQLQQMGGMITAEYNSHIQQVGTLPIKCLISQT